MPANPDIVHLSDFSRGFLLSTPVNDSLYKNAKVGIIGYAGQLPPSGFKQAEENSIHLVVGPHAPLFSPQDIDSFKASLLPDLSQFSKPKLGNSVGTFQSENGGLSFPKLYIDNLPNIHITVFPSAELAKFFADYRWSYFNRKSPFSQKICNKFFTDHRWGRYNNEIPFSHPVYYLDGGFNESQFEDFKADPSGYVEQLRLNIESLGPGKTLTLKPRLKL